jgi:ParB-like chromosome segregation protein Spo0J
MSDPIDRIEWRPAAELTANAYNPNVVFTPELRLLELSIVTSGWIQPILCTTTGIIIDGFHRWMLSKESKPLLAKYGGLVPCAVLDITEGEAMLLTVRINRAKGSHVAVRMSDLVKELIDVHGMDPDQVAKGIGAGRDEVDLLYQDSIFKARNLKEYRYSRAWYPAEVAK